MKAEQFIKDYTNHCSNLLVFSEGDKEYDYAPWITPEQALRAVEIAREEVINTPEMKKEVNLEKELDYNDYMNFFKEHPDYSNRDWGYDECWVFAKYFYELGIKAQKGE